MAAVHGKTTNGFRFMFGPPCPWLNDEGRKSWQSGIDGWTDADWSLFHQERAEFDKALQARRLSRKAI